MFRRLIVSELLHKLAGHDWLRSLRQPIYRYRRTRSYFSGRHCPPWHDFSQPRHPHRWVGCLLGILLRRFHHQRILTHPFEWNRLLRLWRCTTDAYGGRTKVPPHRFTEPADGLCFCLFTSKWDCRTGLLLSLPGYLSSKSRTDCKQTGSYPQVYFSWK